MLNGEYMYASDGPLVYNFQFLGRMKIETSKVIWADRCVHVNPGAAQEASSGEINEKHLARVTEY